MKKTLWVIIVLSVAFISELSFACGSWGAYAWCAYTDPDTNAKTLLAWDVGTGCHVNLNKAALITSNGPFFPLKPKWQVNSPYGIDAFIDQSKVAVYAILPLISPDANPGQDFTAKDFNRRYNNDRTFRENLLRSGISKNLVKGGYSIIRTRQGHLAYVFWEHAISGNGIEKPAGDGETGLGGWMELPNHKVVTCQSLEF